MVLTQPWIETQSNHAFFFLFCFWKTLGRFSIRFANSSLLFSYTLKGTLMQIWKCANVFVFMWKLYVQEFTSKHFTFWDMRIWDMWNVCVQTFRNNRICYKLAYFLRNLQTWKVNISRIHRIKSPKFSGYCFYMNTTYREIFKFALVYLYCMYLSSQLFFKTPNETWKRQEKCILQWSTDLNSKSIPFDVYLGVTNEATELSKQ